MMNHAMLAKKRVLLAMATKGNPVTLHWDEVTGGTVDPTTGSVAGGLLVARTEAVRGFWYEIEEGARIKQQHWQVYEVLHAILDIPPETVIEGRTNLRVEKGGQIFVMAEVADGKTVGKQVEMHSGVELYRTIFLRKAT